MLDNSQYSVYIANKASPDTGYTAEYINEPDHGSSSVSTPTIAWLLSNIAPSNIRWETATISEWGGSTKPIRDFR